MPGGLHVQIGRGVVIAHRQIPSMQAAKLRRGREIPIVALRLRLELQREKSAHAIIVSAKKAQHVGYGSGVPLEFERCGAQARRRAADQTAQREFAGLLKIDGGAKWLGLEINAPAAR